MNKKVNIGNRPSKNMPDAAVDTWVTSRASEEPSKMKRLTIDIPECLHREIKSKTALKGVKMNEDIRAILEREYRK